MANTIITKNSSTASSVPTAVDLTVGELAVNVTDKRLFSKNAGGTIVEVGTNPSQLNFVDNAKAIFGNGSDLQIYHDGSNSYIVDAGTGGLYLNATSQLRMQSFAGEDYIICQNNADVRLFYDNAEKLATTSTGIDVTGTVFSDGLEVSGNFGLGVTPESDWYTANWKAFQIGTSASLASWGGSATLDRVFLSSNAKNTSTNQLTSWDYINSLPASQYAQLDGKHEWRIAPTGTADADITWTQAMILGASGALFVGGTNTASAHVLDDTGGSLFLQSQTNNANIGLSIYVNEGANNRRASFFVDDSLGVYGVESTATSGVPDFVIRRSGNEVARFTADGLTFNGDTAATNALDDYEEGTWTCSIVVDGTTGSGTTGDTTATYVKIGRAVIINVTRRMSGFASVTGAITLSGSLPFTPFQGFAIMPSSRALGLGGTTFIKVNSGNTTLYTRTSFDNDYNEANNEVTTADNRTIKVLEFSACYYTAA